MRSTSESREASEKKSPNKRRSSKEAAAGNAKPDAAQAAAFSDARVLGDFVIDGMAAGEARAARRGANLCLMLQLNAAAMRSAGARDTRLDIFVGPRRWQPDSPQLEIHPVEQDGVAVGEVEVAKVQEVLGDEPVAMYGRLSFVTPSGERVERYINLRGEAFHNFELPAELLS